MLIPVTPIMIAGITRPDQRLIAWCMDAYLSDRLPLFRPEVAIGVFDIVQCTEDFGDLES
jgi:hypothetical protein